MARIVLEVNVVEDGVDIQPVPYRLVNEDVANAQAHQVARELLEYFRGLLKENPAAAAVADALAHESAETITIQQDFCAADPDRVFSKIATNRFWRSGGH